MKNMNIWKLLKKILAPKKCYSCKKEWHFFCEDCHYKLLQYEPSCFICNNPSDNFEIHKLCKNDSIYYDKVIIKYHYKWYFVSKMIKDGKYYFKKDVMYDFWEDLYEVLTQNEDIASESIFVAVPLHFLRKMKRWYNQSEVLIESINALAWIWYHKSILSRKKYTRQQSKLSKNKRIDNMKNSFAIGKSYIDIIDKKEIIIVDDVISTGSTVNEMAKILKQNWAKKVTILCIASD